MQEDMHYYGTYAIARAAGLSVKDAEVVAYSSQYVDESTANEELFHADGGVFQTSATAHTNAEAIGNAIADQIEQRCVWVPFHFFPGNEGDTFSEKLVCVKNSTLSQEMVESHIQHAAKLKNEYGLHLIGIMAHVYADTFSHYGFSGVSSRNNEVEGESFQLDVKNDEARSYIMNKFNKFIQKYTPNFIIKNYRNIASEGASAVTGALGHGAVGTYPDRPFLRWKFTYKKDQKDSGWRDNQQTFLEACEMLHGAFLKFGVEAEISNNSISFNSIKDKIAEILSIEAGKEQRIEAWRDAISSGMLFPCDSKEAINFDAKSWEEEKELFNVHPHSSVIIESDIYKFNQAAIYHRNFCLKELLPKHNLSVI